MTSYAPSRSSHALFDMREKVGGEGRRKASEELQGEA